MFCFLESKGLDSNIVTKLELRNNSLLGTIPTEIGHLANLTYLDLGKIKCFACDCVAHSF
jgi:hypothetical protein